MSARQRNACALVTLALGVVHALLLGSAPARALSSPTPWDGVNPFDCTVQDAGQGTTVPDPGADPYCVRFDKTNQNVTQLGLVQFLSEEPARVAAAVPKCFYYQEDHWRGSLIQSNQQTVIYEFYGHYFFDKATGDGGVWVTGFTVAGHTFDPRTLPGFPPQWDPYFGPGTGGFRSEDEVPVDPSCAAKANNPPAPVYAPPRAPTGPQSQLRCPQASGRLTSTGLGPLKLGAAEGSILARLGPPKSVKRRMLRYCLAQGGNLLVGESRRARTVVLSTTSRAFTLRGTRGRTIAVGTTARSFKTAFPHAKSLLRLSRTTIIQVAGPSSLAKPGTIIAAIIEGRVAYLGVYDPGAIRTRRALRAYLRAAE
jgi:hypothetical protein